MSLRGWVIAALAVGFCTTRPIFAAAPPGWTIAGNAPTDYEFAVDATTAASGTRSASITAKPRARPTGFGMLMQTILADDYRGSRLRLSGYLRTQAANRAQMWMRVDGPDGKILDFDNMDSRPVTGTSAWRRYDIVLNVPSDSVDIAFGFVLVSSGKVWGDDFKLEKVDSTVPLTSAGPVLSRVPVNMDFEAGDSTQPAVWTPRKLHFDSGIFGYSCDYLYHQLKFVLLQLGARASDIDISANSCYFNAPNGPTVIDATFSVLAPADKVGEGSIGTVLDAHWQTVYLMPTDAPQAGPSEQATLSAECVLLRNVTTEILPLFSVRNAKLISGAACRKLHVGLSADLLKRPGTSSAASLTLN